MVCAADVPQSPLAKYPLLLKQVVKYLWLRDLDPDPAPDPPTLPALIDWS